MNRCTQLDEILHEHVVIYHKKPIDEIKVIGQGSRSHGFRECLVCIILLEPVGLDSRNVIRQMARLRLPAGST